MTALPDADDLRQDHAARSLASRAGLVILLGTMTAFGALSIDMYLPGMPALARDLRAEHGTAQLTVAAFLFGLAIGQLVYGPLADRIGRRTPLLFGVGLYTLASIGCALAPTIEVLIALRALQALGACAGIVISRTVVRDLYTPQQSVHVFSMLMLVMGIAPILAPLVGGYVVVFAGWRAIFAILTAFGVLTGLAIFLRLPETRAASVAAHSASEGSLSAYLAVARNGRLMGYALAGAFSAASLFAYIAASSTLLIETYHVPVQAFGWIFGLNALGIIGSGQFNRRLKRFDTRSVLRAANLTACAFAILMTISALTGVGGALGVLVPLWFVLATYGIAAPHAISAAMHESGLRAGAASGLFGFLQSMFGAIAASVTGAFQDGTARPMALVITAVLLASAASLSLVKRQR